MCSQFKWKVTVILVPVRGPVNLWLMSYGQPKSENWVYAKTQMAARGLVWPQIFLLQNKWSSILWILEGYKNWDLCDQNWVSYSYFSFLPILAICYWGFLSDIPRREVAKTQDILWKNFITICLTIAKRLTGKLCVPAVIYSLKTLAGTICPPLGFEIFLTPMAHRVKFQYSYMNLLGVYNIIGFW